MERAPSTLFCPVSKSASESVCLSLHVHVCASAWERGNEKLSTFVWVFFCLYEGEQLQLARKTVSRVLFNSYIYFSTFSFSRPYYYFLQIDFFLPNKTFFFLLFRYIYLLSKYFHIVFIKFNTIKLFSTTSIIS